MKRFMKRDETHQSTETEKLQRRRFAGARSARGRSADFFRQGGVKG
jgi:hypothetical protein